MRREEVKSPLDSVLNRSYLECYFQFRVEYFKNDIDKPECIQIRVTQMVRDLIQATNETNVNIPQMADTLFERATNSSWVVVFKALVTTHHLMVHGNERFIQYLASRNTLFNLSNFLDKSGSHGYDMSTFIRRYSRYLNEKAFSYRQMAFDFARVKKGADGVMRTMVPEKLLKSMPILQGQIDALLEFDVHPNELTNGVINAAFMLLFKDLIKLFACYNDGVINLLEKFFEMKKGQCKDALEIYKRFLTRMTRVSEFLKVAEQVGIDKGDIPDLTQAYESAEDENIWSSEMHRHQYADDMQLYFPFSPSLVMAVDLFNQRQAATMDWMRANKLKLYPLTVWVSLLLKNQVLLTRVLCDLKNSDDNEKSPFKEYTVDEPAPSSLMETLEQHLNSLEGKKPGNSSGAPSPLGKAPAVCGPRTPEVQAGFRRGRGTRDPIANICWIMKKARKFQKNIYFCFIDYAKAFDYVDHNKLWQVLKEMGVPDHLICLLRNLYVGQEATAEPDESPVRIKIAGRNINNLTYADDTTLMAESEEELKSLLMRSSPATTVTSPNSTPAKSIDTSPPVDLFATSSTAAPVSASKPSSDLLDLQPDFTSTTAQATSAAPAGATSWGGKNFLVIDFENLFPSNASYDC
ncbi:hypothetical protein EYD10_06997 [Varanus komodoensis]|nr:hypothetical protein EYD10_06997 [Varanus komodoensis]